MNEPFEKVFKEIGGLWPTKSGKGFSGKLKEDLPAGVYMYAFENRDYDPTMTYPKYKIFIKREDEKPKEPEQSDTEPMPF